MLQFAFCKNNLFLITLLFITLPLVTTGARAQLPKGTWFVQAGATGDGTSAEKPLGTTSKIEQVTRPGDIILLLASDNPLKGGLALKPGQTLMGIPNSGSYPVITNADSTRHGGIGIMLADSVRILNVHVEETFRSGIYGKDVSVQIAEVTVRGANRGKKLLDLNRSMEPFWAPTHGGMVFIQTSEDSDVDISQSKILDAAGHGILSLNYGTAQCRVSVRHCRVYGGSPLPAYDSALGLLAQDSSKAWLEVEDCVFGGRMSGSGRNVAVRTAGGAKAKARIMRSRLGPTGQDGALASSWQSPSEVDMHIEDSFIEGAEMNVEGTVSNYPSVGDMPENEGKVSITIENSVVQSATDASGFKGAGLNIWLGPSNHVSDRPSAVGNYKLTVSNSRIEHAAIAGFAFGNPEINDKGKYRVKFRNNTISGNGRAEIAAFAPDTQIDARKNCWGRPNGPNAERIVVTDEAAEVDTSDPVDCTKIGQE